MDRLLLKDTIENLNILSVKFIQKNINDIHNYLYATWVSETTRKMSNLINSLDEDT
jgi:hypothetical protein